MGTIIDIILKLSPQLLEGLLPIFLDAFLLHWQKVKADPAKLAAYRKMFGEMLQTHVDEANEVVGYEQAGTDLEAERQRRLKESGQK